MNHEAAESNEKTVAEAPYSGNSVPKLLRWIYVIFIGWAIGYSVRYAIPDLLAWLQK